MDEAVAGREYELAEMYRELAENDAALQAMESGWRPRVTVTMDEDEAF